MVRSRRAKPAGVRQADIEAGGVLLVAGIVAASGGDRGRGLHHPGQQRDTDDRHRLSGAVHLAFASVW